MNVIPKKSPQASSSFASLIRGPLIIILMAVVFAASHVFFGSTPFCALNRASLNIPNLPSMRTCAGGYAAVNYQGKPCISLDAFTSRTGIHRAITPETTYMYCSIPKNGCSFHIDILHRVNGDYYHGKRKHQAKNKGKIMFSDEAEVARLLANSSVPKYMVIRNPMVRTLSGYLCKVEKYYPEVEKVPATFQKWAKEQFTGLETWKGMNRHWAAQTQFCGYDMRDVQKKFHVFRVEKPEEYVDFLYKIIPARILAKGWGENKTNYRDFVLSPHKRTGHTVEKFYDYYADMETFDLVERTYRRDIDELGYRDQVDEMRRTITKMLGREEEEPEEPEQ